MIDILGDDMLDLDMENKQKRLTARNAAIEALEGVIDGFVSEDEYNHLVAEYKDVLEEIAASERNHLAIGVDDNAE
jgi:hypothetical protein